MDTGSTVGLLPRIITSTSVTVTDIQGGKTYVAADDHLNFDAIIEALKDPNTPTATFFPLFDIPKAIEKFTGGNVTVTAENVVLYRGKELHNALTQRMVEMLEQKYDISAMVKFMDNLMLNPSNSSVDGLYRFLEFNRLPITPDGCFLAYKRVDDDYKDLWTHTIDNHIGKTIEMLRNEVDDNHESTCSTGLHFCSLRYLAQYRPGVGRIIIVKVNPKDVVSFPRDAENSKGRTCRYEVVGDHEAGADWERFLGPVSDEFEEDKDEEDFIDEILNGPCPDCGHVH